MPCVWPGVSRLASASSFERAALLTPNYSTLEINRGVVEGQLGTDADAERHFRRALDLNADASAHFFYARWLVRRGRAGEALPHLRAALRLSPGFDGAHALLMRVDDAAAGEAAELRTLVDETQSIDPGNSALADVTRMWPTYAAAMAASSEAAAREDWPAAAHAARGALRHDPASADAARALASALQSLGLRIEGWSSARARAFQHRGSIAGPRASQTEPSHAAVPDAGWRTSRTRWQPR